MLFSRLATRGRRASVLLCAAVVAPLLLLVLPGSAWAANGDTGACDPVTIVWADYGTFQGTLPFASGTNQGYIVADEHSDLCRPWDDGDYRTAEGYGPFGNAPGVAGGRLYGWGQLGAVAAPRPSGYPGPPPPPEYACDFDLSGKLDEWGGYGGGGAWGASDPEGKTLWEIVQQATEEVRNPMLLWRNLKAENPELVGAYESYEGWFWAQYDELTDGWFLLDRNGDPVSREALGFGSTGASGQWSLGCDVERDGVLDPPVSAPTSPPVIVTVTQPPAPTSSTPPSGGCDFGITDPSSWLCSLGGIFGQLLDVFRAVLRAIVGLVGDFLELLKDLFIPGPGTFDKLGELKTAFTTHPPGSILVGGGQFVGGLATGLEGAGCAAGPDFSPDGFEGLMQLPGQCEGSGFGMLDLLYGFVTVCLYASLMWSLWYLAESHFGVGMEA